MSWIDPYPRAWRGRERFIALVIRARFLSRPEDAHLAHLSKLFADSFALRSFPTHDGFRSTVAEICDLVRDQVFEDRPVANDHEQRLLRIVAWLRQAVNERDAVP